jgi:hypothetical protein
VTYGSGEVYIGSSSSVRAVNPVDDRLTTPAGTGVFGPAVDGESAARASLKESCGVGVDQSGNLLIADSGNARVWVRAVRTGTFYGRAMAAGHLYAVAGDGTYDFSGDGGPATSAGMTPLNVTVDGTGNLLIADGAIRVRVVAEQTGTFYGQAMTAGNIYTVAGGGTAHPGDGGPATNASFAPASVAVDGAGNLVIADHNNRVRVVAEQTGTFYGQAMTAGDIYTIAGDGHPGGLGNGGPATSARLWAPADATLDGAGNVVIADRGNNRVRVVAEQTGTFYGQAMTAGDIYNVAGRGGFGFSGDGGPATRAQLWQPLGVVMDGDGNLVIADSQNSRVRVVAEQAGTFYGRAMAAGHIYTVAGTTAASTGDGGPATHAQISAAVSVAVGGAGTVIADYSGQRIWVAAAQTGTFCGRAMTAGNIYTVAGDGTAGFAGDGGPAASAELNGPEDVTVDAAGNLVIADSQNSRVRVVAGQTGTFYGQAMTAGHIYTVAGDGTTGFAGDGGPATGAELNEAKGAAVDGAGNLVISDSGNERVRVVAERTGTFYGRAMTAGHIYTVAGNGTLGFAGDRGPAASAEFNDPLGAAVDAAGNLVISDSGNARVRLVAEQTGTFYGQAMTAGDIYSIADVIFPSGKVAVDANGNVLIAGTEDHKVLALADKTGGFYGVPMRAGTLYTVAGNGTPQFAGDGGRATAANVAAPGGVAVTAGGNLLIADTGNLRIRMVTG